MSKALCIFQIDQTANRNDIARGEFFSGQLWAQIQRPNIAALHFDIATRLREEITGDKRSADCLKMEDFDELVAFWSR